MKLTPEQINEHIDKFISIYKNGKSVNPIPDDVKVTAWCEYIDDVGFVRNMTKDEMGLNILVVKSWILEDDLQKLFK